MALAYADWTGDEERRATVTGLADLLLGETGLAQSLLGPPDPNE